MPDVTKHNVAQHAQKKLNTARAGQSLCCASWGSAGQHSSSPDGTNMSDPNARTARGVDIELDILALTHTRRRARSFIDVDEEGSAATAAAAASSAEPAAVLNTSAAATEGSRLQQHRRSLPLSISSVSSMMLKRHQARADKLQRQYTKRRLEVLGGDISNIEAPVVTALPQETEGHRRLRAATALGVYVLLSIVAMSVFEGWHPLDCAYFAIVRRRTAVSKAQTVSPFLRFTQPLC